MTLAATVLLGAIAGFTIYLGLPFARLKHPRPSLQAFLNALATGILVFLLWDVITKASEPITTALQAARSGQATSFALLLTLFAGGFGVGLLSLVYFERRFLRRPGQTAPQAPRLGAASPQQLALMIATGIGLHNFSEESAIGQSSRAGAIGLATILIVGFGLHNTTEGFGIAAPLTTAGTRPAWAFLGLVGLIGGGPTFLGTVVGFSVRSEAVFVLFLALAAGSIFYVVSELLHVGRRFALRELAMWGVFLGFLAGYGTDLILTWGGA
jgi:zinc transporter, ZIP family